MEWRKKSMNSWKGGSWPMGAGQKQIENVMMDMLGEGKCHVLAYTISCFSED